MKNIKNILVILLLSTAVLTSCKKDDKSLFDKSPDDRLNEALAAYQAKLTGATNGWKGFVYPKSGGVYTFYFKFNDANRVNILSSFDSASSVTLKESSYRLKALQQPSLLFDTYSYLHVLADPNENVNGGPRGVGLQSDFEFYFDSSSADTINLVGRFNGSKATLIRATPEEAAGFINGQLATGFLLNKIQTYFERLTIGSEKFDFHIDPSARTLSFADATGNLLDTVLTTRYYMTFGGIGFVKPITVGNQNITGLTNITYNSAGQTISCTLNNAAATISNVTVPLKVDVNAPTRWWNAAVSSSSYWISLRGFHINGVDDAYSLSSVSGYSFLYYEPKYGTYNGVNYDLFAPIVNDSLNYGAAYIPPTFTANGRIIYKLYGVLGTVPSNQSIVFNNISAKLADRNGWYLVQTSESIYDMVSSFDEKSWINWQ